MARRQDVADQERYRILEGMLQGRQNEIKNKLRSLRHSLPAELAQVKDEEEQSMEDFVLGMDFAVMQMESETLKRIDEAMLRLQQGSYGLCGECDEPISEARLRALPFAVLCRDCQEIAESEGRKTARTTLSLHPRHSFEESLSISARNDRTPPGREGVEASLFNYATGAAAPAPARRPPSSAPEQRSVRTSVPARRSRRA